MCRRFYISALLGMGLLATGACGASLGQSLGDVDPGSGKTPLLEMTKALLKEVARSSTTSEVLTLNLTNLVILLVIKAIIFGFGFFGAGVGRSFNEAQRSYDESDLMMMMSFALGSTSDDYDCLYRVACEEPSKAKQYLSASKMLLKGAKFAKGIFGYNPKYEDIVYGLQEAVDFRNSGGKCSTQYVCKHVPSL